jgi:hypothetical protein
MILPTTDFKQINHIHLDILIHCSDRYKCIIEGVSATVLDEYVSIHATDKLVFCLCLRRGDTRTHHEDR